MTVNRPLLWLFCRLLATAFPQVVFGRRHVVRAASRVQAEPDLRDVGALCETPQEFGIGAGEAIDGLIDIADTKQSHPRARDKTESHHHSMQRRTEILIFIDGEARILCNALLSQPVEIGQTYCRERVW